MIFSLSKKVDDGFIPFRSRIKFDIREMPYDEYVQEHYKKARENLWMEFKNNPQALAHAKMQYQQKSQQIAPSMGNPMMQYFGAAPMMPGVPGGMPQMGMPFGGHGMMGGMMGQPSGGAFGAGAAAGYGMSGSRMGF